MLLVLCLLKIIYIFSIPSECSGRIINGGEAGLDHLRYTVSIRIREYDALWFGYGHNCGGSLIKPNVVLTAAHCFANLQKLDGSYHPPNLFTVVMGSLNRMTRDSYTRIFDIQEFITYKKIFDSLGGDIALAFLSGWVPRDHPIVQPISINRKEMPTNTTCHVSGWGQMKTNIRSDTLKRATVSVIDYNVCATLMGYKKKLLGIGVLCARGFKGRDGPCKGDSGGPLVCRGRLAGIVSWGADGKCHLPLQPGVYTDVAFYSSWIDKHLDPQPEESMITNNTTRLGDHLVTIVFLIVNISFKTHAVLFRNRSYHFFTF